MKTNQSMLKEALVSSCALDGHSIGPDVCEQFGAPVFGAFWLGFLPGTEEPQG